MTHQKKGFTIVCNKTNIKIPDPGNAKKHCQSFLREKHKTSKTIKDNYLRTKIYRNPKHY